MYMLISTISLFIGLIIYLLNMNRLIHIMQLEGYKNIQFINWSKKNIDKTLTKPLFVLIIVFLFFFMDNFIKNSLLSSIIILTVFLISSYFFLYPLLRKKQKKPLVYTARLKRLLASNIFVIIFESLIFIWLFRFENIILWFAVTLVISSINITIANLIIYPVEILINRYYIKSAIQKLNSINNLIKIGITGSYGKTSTKYILGTILNEKYKTFITPDSYNTTMGTVKAIRESLEDSYEVFISEMGARNIGDIKEICDIVRPHFGIITSIGSQHLETFDSIDNIIKTKYELIQGLAQEGIAFLPSDNEYCYNLFKNELRPKVLYGLDNHIEETDITAIDIEVSDKGSSFTLVDRKNKEDIKCSTKLLGKHNILNILGCASIARQLGLSMHEISQGICKVEQIPHRLQILPTQNGTIVIDDAFNSNPVGSKIALDVLNQFSSGKKIIITPGMVELGAQEYGLNKEFGEYMSQVVDYAILIGKKRSLPIQDGLNSRGFDFNNVFIVSNLNEAIAKLSKITKSGDIILFENDLPDNYEED